MPKTLKIPVTYRRNEMKKSLVLPTNENIFVRRIDPTTITEGGIVVPDQSIDRPAEGTIVAIGPSVYTSDRRVHELAAYQLYLDKNNRFDDEIFCVLREVETTETVNVNA